MTPAILMHAASDRDADLFAVVPEVIVDPFLYVEAGERRHAVSWAGDAGLLGAHGVEIVDAATLGKSELARSGMRADEVEAEIALRACRELGVTAALVPPRFPVFVADHLRANGIELTVDGETFVARRRRKSPAQLEGIRRAQAAADAAMGVAARMVAELRSAEEIRAAMRAACDEHDVELRADDALVAHGAQAAVVHDLGSGPLVAGEPVVIDFCPQDRRSRCWTDMTRTFVAGGGEAPEELRRFWELARRALEDVRGAVRAGASGRELWQRSCAPFDEAGIPTLRTAPDGVPLAEGYYHGLGHGVGLEVHERPNLGRVDDTLMAGDVIAVEPGCYRPGFGGARLEDLLVVTEDGCETVTSFPYDLAP